MVCALCSFPRDLDLMSCPLLSGARKTLSPLRVGRSIKQGKKGPTAKIKKEKNNTQRKQEDREDSTLQYLTIFKGMSLSNVLFIHPIHCNDEQL